MKRESTFFLWLAIVTISAIFGVFVAWCVNGVLLDSGEIILLVAFCTFALLATMWNLKTWAHYRLQEDIERRNTKS